MKKSIILPLIVAVVLCVAGPAFAHEVWFDPFQATVDVGSTFDLLVVANLDQSTTNISMQVDYDHTLMALNSVMLQSPWATFNELPPDVISGGTMFIAPSEDNMPLALLRFTCLAAGSSSVSLSGAFPDGYAFAYLNPWFPEIPGTYYDATFSAAQVNQVAVGVPEPGILSLLGIGFTVLGLPMLRRSLG